MQLRWPGSARLGSAQFGWIGKNRKVMKKVRKVGIPCGRCRKKSKKHAARTPVGEGGKEGGSEAGRGGRESGPKSRHSVWEGSKKVTKTCSENAGRGEGGRARLGSARLGPVGLPPGPAPARLGLGTAWAPMPATTKLKVSDQRRTSSSA